jgi:hypothetical protein
MGIMAQWFRRYAIVSKQKRLVRNKRFHSFETAKTVGLVFKVEKNALPPEVLSTMKFLTNKRINCSLIGYYDGEVLPESIINSSQMSVFTKKELSWYGRPIADDVTRFLQSGYDIVIDFCRQPEVYPIQYIVSTVQASMIIGGVLYAHCPYDLIIDAQQICTPEKYVEQIKHYLSIINNPQNVEQQTKS